MGCEAYFDEIKKKHVYFHYHLNCQHITDIAGDIKLKLLESNQNILFIYYYIEIVSNDSNRWDLKLIWMQLRKKKFFSLSPQLSAYS